MSESISIALSLPTKIAQETEFSALAAMIEDHLTNNLDDVNDLLRTLYLQTNGRSRLTAILAARTLAVHLNTDEQKQPIPMVDLAAEIVARCFYRAAQLEEQNADT